jgi:hypothetical protein
MSEKSTKGIWKVISASSVGTLIEWYDFYIFGSLAVVISTKFFPLDLLLGFSFDISCESAHPEACAVQSLEK